MTYHGAALRQLSKDGLPDRIASDLYGAEVPPRLRAMLDYALALTRPPAEVGPEHVAVLRKAGLSDEEVHRVAVVAYFNFVNRIAEGLGVELEA